MDEILDLIERLRQIREQKRELTRREKLVQRILLSKLRALGIGPESPEAEREKDKGGNWVDDHTHGQGGAQ